MHPSFAPPRAAPPWLLDQPYDETSLGALKSGKEAEVFLIERRYAGGSTALLVHKRYRPRRPARGELRELGFKKATSYRHDSTYRSGWFLSSRDRRAVAHKTDHGHEVIERMWPIQEMAMLERAWASGASVPYPVERTDDGVVMEFIGDADAAAPRLAQAHSVANRRRVGLGSAARQPAGHDFGRDGPRGPLRLQPAVVAGAPDDHRPAAGRRVHHQRRCPGAAAPRHRQRGRRGSSGEDCPLDVEAVFGELIGLAY